jgi:hypothetical protein
MQIQHEIDGKYLSIKTETAEYSVWISHGNVLGSVNATIQKTDDEIERLQRRREVLAEYIKLINGEYKSTFSVNN